MAVYLDCNATTPVEPEVVEAILRYTVEEYGNAGSRTHEYGTVAKRAVQEAREEIASLAGVASDCVTFTSGATESNNLAILGLAEWAAKAGKRHLVSTQIEHKSVLEPLEALRARGFEVTLVPPTSGGWVEPGAVRAAVRADTCLVSVMHANNETGVLQPIDAIAEELGGTEAYLHVDAAQTFGKTASPLAHPRVDLASVTAHKVYGPRGIGALVARRRGFERAPLRPLMFGGGQERGLRPGTLPVPLIAGFGVAARLAGANGKQRARACAQVRDNALAALAPLLPRWHGDQAKRLPNVLNGSFEGIDSEALMLAWKELAAVSNGSACTSQSYELSHVLLAMGLTADAVQGAARLSWSHLTPPPDWAKMRAAVAALRRS